MATTVCISRTFNTRPVALLELPVIEYLELLERKLTLAGVVESSLLVLPIYCFLCFTARELVARCDVPHQPRSKEAYDHKA
jgi:hypothetical protein